jgi:uncharacterized protein (TIGR00297 family)
LIENLLSSTDLLLRALAGFAGAAIVSAIAVRLRSLSVSGAAAATFVGTVASGAGWDFAVVLLVFFISATAVSRFRAQTKNQRLSRIIAKGNARDALQVLANGSVFAAAALWMIARPGEIAMFAAVAALAGACADTWATEIGSLSRHSPRSVLSGKPVPAGTSGGVTLLGVVAAAVGAATVGLAGMAAGMPREIVSSCIIAGLAGASVDSLVGASFQSRRWCAACSEYTEREIHSCGTATSPATGISWLDNDRVNFICTLVAALVGALWVL